VNIRRVVLDVDMGIAAPTLLEIGEAVSAVGGVEAFNLSVEEIDIKTVGLIVVVEGSAIEYQALVAAIERTGAVVHSIDELVAGNHVVEFVPRQR
jgi:uncharacterized protein